MKIAIVGGHFSPALAVIEQLPKNIDIIYIGRKHALEGDSALSLEYQAIQARNISFIELKTGRLQRRFTRRTIPSLFKLPLGFRHAFRIIKKERPTVVLAFGGYLSVPICFAAYALRIPMVIHEQTFGAGLSNRIIAKFATKICISWETSRKFFPKNKTVFTGNPLMKSTFQERSFTGVEFKEKLPILCIVGGSTGSHAINTLIKKCLPELIKRYNVIHQTGDAKEFLDYDELENMRKGLDKPLQQRYHVYKFIEPEYIATAFNRSMLVVSRAGVNTVATLLALKKPALIIPLPAGQHNEQKTNAHFFVQTGLGELLEQKNATKDTLLAVIHAMIEKIVTYKVNGTFDMHAQKNAAENIVQVLKSV